MSLILASVTFNDLDVFMEEFGDVRNAEQLVRLQGVIAPFMLRRIKEDVEKSIPPKEETIIDVELTMLQKRYYRAIYEKNRSFLYRQGDPLPLLDTLLPLL